MKKTLFLTPVILFLSGCASIASKSNWPRVVITNKKGIEVFSGRTPAAMRLKSGAGFFAKESYTISLAMDGYETKKINIESKINGWYFGNVLIGGLIGLLIIDPATGAMYRLESAGISEDMLKSSSTQATLKIIDKSAISQSWKQHLVKIIKKKKTKQVAALHIGMATLLHLQFLTILSSLTLILLIWKSVKISFLLLFRLLK